jgi:hypothetical protein
MELDDLKVGWKRLDERLTAGIALSLRVATELRRDRAQRSIRRLAWVPAVELVLNVCVTVWLGAFCVGHVGQAAFVVPGLLLAGMTIALIAASARQLAILSSLDYAAPVVSLQRGLAALYTIRVRETRWVLVGAPLVWLPVVIVVAKGWLGFDLYRVFNLTWLAANLAFGLAVVVVAMWVSVHWADRFRSPWWTRLADAFAGRSVTRAVEEVEAIAEFERA